MIHNIISNDNWNVTFYENPPFKSMINMEMDLVNLSEDPNYVVTVLDEQNIEIFQKSFTDCNAACKYINYKYHQSWEFKTMVKTDTGGCSTCVAK
jgi:hypothetical protein